MKVIDLLYEYALDKSQYRLDKYVFLNALFFNVAVAISMKNIRLRRETNSGFKDIIPSYYGITFALSGAGKDHSHNLTSELFKDFHDTFSMYCEQFYEARKEENENVPDPKILYINSPFIAINSSWQGLQKTAQTVQDLGRGGVNVICDELGDDITGMGEIVKMLKSAWDKGESRGPTNVSNGGENYYTVTDTQFNALLFGSPGPFEIFPKKMEAFLEYLISGMARRSFVYKLDNYKKSENRNKDFETMNKKSIQSIMDYIEQVKEHIKSIDYIKYPQSIKDKLADWDIQMDIQRESSHSPIAQDLYNQNKIEKLLCILAVLDLSNEVTEDHLEFAKEFTIAVDSTAEQTVEQKPNFIKIYEAIDNRKFASKTDVIKAVTGVTSKVFDDELALVQEYANLQGNTLISQEFNTIKKYSISRMSKSDTEKVIISINDNMSATEPIGFRRMQGNFNNIHSLICSKRRYSAGTFLNEHIKDENYLKEQNLFIVDVDDGLSIKDAMSLFSDYHYFIAETRSHQKEKHGVVCDRFRIVFPTLTIFSLEPNIYKKMYENVLDSLGISYDAACKNASRWYYGVEGAKYYYNESKEEPKLLDIRPFIPNSAENDYSNSSISNYDKDDAPKDYRIDGAIRWFLASTTHGERNENLFKLGCLINQHIEDQTWAQQLEKCNSYLNDSLPDKEVRGIINSIQRRLG